MLAHAYGARNRAPRARRRTPAPFVQGEFRVACVVTRCTGNRAGGLTGPAPCTTLGAFYFTEYNGSIMDSVDLQVLRSANEWVVAGRRAVLATVVRTWGSSPRPIGALAAFRDDGTVVGSVSGGCVEDDMILRMRAGELPQERPGTTTYGVSAEEAQRFGLPCGGTLELVLEPLTPASGLGELLARIERHELVMRR